MKIGDLSPEIQEKAKACKTLEEFAALVKAEGLNMTDESLDAVSGGVCCPTHGCDDLDSVCAELCIIL